MQLVEFDSDKGKIWVNPSQVVKISAVSTDANASEIFLVTPHENSRIVVKAALKKAVDEVNRCLK
jgi:hypothetical protein